MNIQIVLSDDAVAGWQDHLDTIVNSQRVEANLKPQTLQEWFQEAEETAGIQKFVLKGKNDRYALVKSQNNLTDKDLFILANAALRNAKG